MSGVADGYDWSLPSSAHASNVGRVANVRAFGLTDNWLRKIQSAPVIPGIQQTVELWVFWRELEATDNQFDFTVLDRFVAECEIKKFTLYIRLMTSDKRTAPTYFEQLSIGDAPINSVPHSNNEACTTSRGQPWNIEHEEMHSRYKRLVSQMGRYCRSPTVVAMFAGWMSCSWGDEGIGPANHGYDGHHGEEEPQLVRERLDAWAQACPGPLASKVVMGGKSVYGRNLGFGLREGFVEMYWYRPAETSYASYEGHTINASTGYIEIDETNVLANGQATNADENEEYSPAWSSEWRCPECDSLGGEQGSNTFNAASPVAGQQSRFGSIQSFPYRYMMSMLRALHLRSTMLILDPKSIVNVALSRYVGLSLGHSVSSTSDAWCFLVQGTLTDGRLVNNWERWLTQRDSTDVSVNGGQPAARDARFYTTPFNASYAPSNRGRGGATDFIAKAGTEIAFALAVPFQSRLQQTQQAWVKVSFFDVGAARRIVLLAGSTTSTGVRTCRSTTPLGSFDLDSTPSNNLRTATFSIEQPASLRTFCVAGRDLDDGPQEAVVSFVRVVM
jgi:hypothetical protein